MKILKPGKVEQRKFMCPKCVCEFVADSNDVKTIREGFNEWRNICFCPTCSENLVWEDGEPYEDPMQSDRDRLITILHKNWAMDDEFADDVAQKLIANGVTFE